MTITPPFVFFRKIPETWVVTSTGPCMLNLVKHRSIQPMDTTINSISYPADPHTSVEELAENVNRAFTAKQSPGFLPNLNNGDLRKIGGVDFAVMGGLFEAPNVGHVLQNVYFNVQQTPTTLNIIEIVTLMLMDNMLEDEPEIEFLLDNAIIAKMRR